MNFNPLEAISPVDGRYRSKLAALSDFFSEKALIQYRVKVEALYFIELAESGIPQLSQYPSHKNEKVKAIFENFTLKDAESIKEKIGRAHV